MSRETTQIQPPAATFHPLTSGGILQRKCQSCGQHTLTAQQCEDCEKKKRTLQRRLAHPEQSSASSRSGHPASATTVSPESRANADFTHDFSRLPAINAAPSSDLPRESGRPLGRAIAQHFRPQLGDLIDQVRIHDQGPGAQFAHRQRAVAVTSGTHIYFANRAYQPHTLAGQNLLAHELAHVHQQHRPNGPPQGYQSRVGDVFEREADHFALTGRLSTATVHPAAATPHIYQHRTAIEQVATILRNAVEGLGTDEAAIFNALTGRTPAEITAIEAAYEALSGGEKLVDRLRSELSGRELSRALSLLHGETAETETARRLWDAMRGLGTDEEAIYAAVAGRTAAQWAQIQRAYRELTGDALVAELQDELTSREWQYLQTLLPGAAGGAATAADRATVIANRLEAAVEGLGTDEDAIYAALTGHSDAELRSIEQRFQLLTGQELAARLRDELTDAEYARVQQLLHPTPNPERIARRLRAAVQGPGTRERAILAALTGRSPAELVQVRTDYQRLYDESLEDRLRAELSGSDLTVSLELLQAGVLEPEDEIKLAVQGLGTDEERLFAVLTELRAAPNPRGEIQRVMNAYATKGYGDMIQDISSDLSGADLDRARTLLIPEWVETEDCTTARRALLLDSVTGAIALADNAISRLDADTSAGALSAGVRTALDTNFNPGALAGAVDLNLASNVRTVLDETRTDLSTKSDLKCTTSAGDCDPAPSCASYTYAWTYALSGATVRVCEAFFSCLAVPQHPWGMLHEFVHHTGVDDKAYEGTPGFANLQPLGDDSSKDSLDNADSYATFATQI